MGWMELMVVGVAALIVVGPKDLPVMFQALGKMTAKVRRLAREFSTAMNEAANATGASDITKELKGLTSAKSLGIDKLREAADSFDKWEPGKTQRAVGPETAKLTAERAEQARKIREKTAEAAKARIEKEAAEKAAEKPADKPAEKTAEKSADKPAAKPRAKAKPAATAKAAKPAAKAKPAATKAAGSAKPRAARKAKTAGDEAGK